MKKVEVKTYNMGESLFNAILFFLLGVVLFTNPNGVVKFVIYIIGGLLILTGIFKLLVYYKTAQYNPNKNEIVSGTLYMLIGMITIVCAIVFFDAIETVLRLTFAVFLLYVGINRLIYAAKESKENRMLYLINAILIIAAAIALAVIQNLPLKIVGLFIVGYSIVEIIGFVLCKKNGTTTEVKEATIVEVKEKK